MASAKGALEALGADLGPHSDLDPERKAALRVVENKGAWAPLFTTTEGVVLENLLQDRPWEGLETLKQRLEAKAAEEAKASSAATEAPATSPELQATLAGFGQAVGLLAAEKAAKRRAAQQRRANHARGQRPFAGLSKVLES